MHRFSIFRAALIVVCTVLLTAPAAAQTYTFTKIVDSADGVFVANSMETPAPNDAGQVAFRGSTFEPFVTGVFRGSGGPLTTIVQDPSLAFVGNFTSINNAGAVSFGANLGSGEEVIFRGSGGPLTTIADATGKPFGAFSFETSVNNAGSVAFQAQLDTTFDEGLFHGNGGPVTTVFNTATSPFNDSFAAPSINDAGQIAFEAGRDAGDRGIFRFEPGSSSFTTIATNAGSFTALEDNPSMNASGRVAFHAELGATDEGLFVGAGAAPEAVAIASSSPFRSFGVPSLNDAGQVAFLATRDDNVTGLFAGTDPVGDLVLQTFTTFDGRLVVNIFFSREGLNSQGELAFLVGFGDGSAAIYRATLIPEPAGAGILLIGAASALLGARRRRR